MENGITTREFRNDQNKRKENADGEINGYRPVKPGNAEEADWRRHVR